MKGTEVEKIELRLAELTDLDKILELQKEAYLQEAEIYQDFEIQPLTQSIDSITLEWQRGIVIKALKNGQIIGSVRAELVGNICKIGKLIVRSDFQNQGIGKRLVAEIEELFHSCSIYELFTGDKSEKNLALYRKLGYKVYKTEQISNKLQLVYFQKKKKYN